MNKTPPRLRTRWLHSRQTRALMSMFADNGFTARFVGGAVRNSLLGQPVKDFDVATDAPPEKVLEMAQNAGFGAKATGLAHGTVTLVVEGRVYEVTTLRVDVESHGRHASVAFTRDWREDAARRDFTINAIYAGADGRIFDPLGGYEDLMAGRVRFIGRPEDRIREDYLRILRFFRFSAGYGGGRLEPEGLLACERLRQGLQRLSCERVGAELKQLLLMPKVRPVLDVMYCRDMLLPLTSCVPHPGRLARWLALEKHLNRPPRAMERLGALFVLKKEDAGALASRLRLSNREKHSLAVWCRPPAPPAPPNEKQAHLLAYRLGDDYRRAIAIDWLYSGSGPSCRNWRRLYNLPERWTAPSFPLQGRDLINRGMPAGPAIGRELRRLENKWIDSDFTLKREELLKL